MLADILRYVPTQQYLCVRIPCIVMLQQDVRHSPQASQGLKACSSLQQIPKLLKSHLGHPLVDRTVYLSLHNHPGYCWDTNAWAELHIECPLRSQQYAWSTTRQKMLTSNFKGLRQDSSFFRCAQIKAALRKLPDLALNLVTAECKNNHLLQVSECPREVQELCRGAAHCLMQLRVAVLTS